jgi:hypothetical protein
MKDALNIILFLIHVSLLLTINSCIKEEFDPDKLDTEFIINPDVAAPLGYIHYELDEILKDSTRSWTITIDNDSVINLEYEAEVFSQKASDFLYFNEINYNGSISNNSTEEIDFRLVWHPIYEYLYKSVRRDTILLQLSGTNGPIEAEIDSIKVKSISVSVSLSTQYNKLDGFVVMSSHNIRNFKYGKWSDWQNKVPIQTGYQTTIIEDCVVIPINDSTHKNAVPLELDLWPFNSPVVVPVGETIISYYVTIYDLTYSAIYGHLGNINIPVDQQTLMIDFFNTIAEGTFYFEQPELRFIFNNSFGLPVQVMVNNFQALRGTGNPVDIIGPGVPSVENVKVIKYPTLAQFGQTVLDSISLNNSNSNLKSAMQISPDRVVFDAEAVTNPSGNDTYNFLKDNSQLNITSKLILPVYGYTDFMTISDSVKYNFEDFFKNPPKEIKRMALRLIFRNGFPVDISSQIYLLDDNHNIVDSIFEEEYAIKAGADLDGDGLVEPIMSDPVEVELTREKIDNVAISRYLYFKGRVKTTDSDIPVSYKFYSFYFLDAYIGAVGELELNSTGI